MAQELDEGLRQLIDAVTRLREDSEESRAMIYALLQVLDIDFGAFEAARDQARILERERRQFFPKVQLEPDNDKHNAQSPADLDCKALHPICKARCCRLTFPLSRQDLDEGVVRWRPSRPFMILQENNRCVHQESWGGCGVYEHRPKACRIYDCRTDKRIWADFEKRILAPD